MALTYNSIPQICFHKTNTRSYDCNKLRLGNLETFQIVEKVCTLIYSITDNRHFGAFKY